MISRFYVDGEGFTGFPRDLLDGSRETARVAERIIQQLGFEDHAYAPAVSMQERLSWAIEAMEEHRPTERLRRELEKL